MIPIPTTFYKTTFFYYVFKFNEWELKGVPVRIEIGPRDVESNKLIIARRDNSEKLSIPIDEIRDSLKTILDEIQNNLFNQAKVFRNENTHNVENYNEFKDIIKKGGFVKCGWDGNQKTEQKIKEETKATIRRVLIPQLVAQTYSSLLSSF